jgi:hypothetical protein
MNFNTSSDEEDGDNLDSNPPMATRKRTPHQPPGANLAMKKTPTEQRDENLKRSENQQKMASAFVPTPETRGSTMTKEERRIDRGKKRKKKNQDDKLHKKQTLDRGMNHGSAGVTGYLPVWVSDIGTSTTDRESNDKDNKSSDEEEEEEDKEDDEASRDQTLLSGEGLKRHGTNDGKKNFQTTDYEQKMKLLRLNDHEKYIDICKRDGKFCFTYL